jgi:hypothetical protein
MGMNDARDVIDDALSYEEEKKERSARIAFELTDGTNSSYDIEEYIDYSYKWASTRQMEWSKLGIVEKTGENQPYEHIASLTELGLHCPDIPDPESDEDDADSDDAESEEEVENAVSDDPSAEPEQSTLEQTAEGE